MIMYLRFVMIMYAVVHPSDNLLVTEIFVNLFWYSWQFTHQQQI